MLRTVAHLWQQEERSRNAQEIAKRGAQLHDELRRAAESWDEVGKRLGKAHEAWDEAKRRLHSGQGNAIDLADELRTLGVQPPHAALDDDLVETARESEALDLAEPWPVGAPPWRAHASSSPTESRGTCGGRGETAGSARSDRRSSERGPRAPGPIERSVPGDWLRGPDCFSFKEPRRSDVKAPAPAGSGGSVAALALGRGETSMVSTTAKRAFSKLDIVGDVHGQWSALQSLGRALGYRVDDDWSHREGRRLLFVGDLIDRGPRSFEVADLVRVLCARGDALCLMGNHELNLVEWYNGRKKTKKSNRPTTVDVQSRPEAWKPILDFFTTLPLAVELDDLRVTHAVWHGRCVDELGDALASPSAGAEGAIHSDWLPLVRLHSPYDGHRLRGLVPKEKFVDETYGLQTERSFEILLKGHEEPTPEPFWDNDGTRREKVRVEWWQDGRPEAPRDRRIVFGHYWNMPPIPGHHEAFVPPHPSGHPALRAWFDEYHRHVEPAGTEAVPDSVHAVCIDYNGMTRATGGRPCVGAYRHPEAQVVWAV